MEADWTEIHSIVSEPPGPRAHPTAVTCLAFDNSQDLLWSGNGYGRVSSHYSTQLIKYTSYRAHDQVEGPVCQILTCEKGILSISGKSVHLASRRGPALWHLKNDAFKDLKCMAFTCKGVKEILVAGNQSTMFKINVDEGTITQTIDTEHPYHMMRRAGQYICAATGSGSVNILDSDTATVVQKWDAHRGVITDMDARTDILVTCGATNSGYGQPYSDMMAMVFDLKSLKRLPPIPVPIGASYVRLHPRLSTTGIAVALMGQVQVVDLINVNSTSIPRHFPLPYESIITSFEMSPSGEVIAFVDSQHQIRLWGSPSKARFNEHSFAPDFANEAQAQQVDMDWTQKTALSTIGMPFYRDTLLSAWPSHLISEVGALPPKIDPSIQANLKKSELGYFAPNPFKTKYRNQAEQTRTSEKKVEVIAAPKFLSEKARNAPAPTEGRRKSDTFEALADRALNDVTKKEVPNMYGNVEIKYSKFGVDDFDFAFYNNTVYSGLETHITNSYANPLLQLLRFIPCIRNLALKHTATSCAYDDCLLCQLGYLVDMMEKAAGLNCQATNFLKALTGLREVSNLRLLEDHALSTPLTTMIQSLGRFLLGKFAGDYRLQDPTRSQAMDNLDKVLQTSSLESKRCAQCKMETKKTHGAFAHDLLYPSKNSSRTHGRAFRPTTFSQILKTSVESQSTGRGWCDRCKRYQQMDVRKTIQDLPAVLMFNAAINSQEAKSMWATPNWLPQEFGVVLNNQGQFFCFEGEDLKLHLERRTHPIIVYELMGYVADVTSGDNQKPHLVSMINVSPSSPEPTDENTWYIFNDFLVRSVSTKEALRFDSSWKLPSVLAYQVKSARHVIDDSWKDRLDTSLLFQGYPLPKTAGQASGTDVVRTLSPAIELPAAGTPVAIDAEFVLLRAEEIHVTADGTREVARPSRQGLARVSVLRGQGVDEGVPFIDDYVAISEPIVNYLTEYSGIMPGDLDPLSSTHPLVSLKVAYKKLWLLLNLGCVFVGHGLLKDFRIINIHVPKKQVVDTVDKFFIKERQRKLNLKFLSWHILNEEIQAELNGHDSIEDARTALKLWRKWQEYEDAGITHTILIETYKKGAEVNWRVPGTVGRPGTSAGVEGATGFGTPERARSRAHTPSVGGTETPGRTSARSRDLFGSPLK